MAGVHHTSKQCSRCSQMKPLEGFNKDSSRTDGLRIYCRECHAAHTAAWRQKNRLNAAKYSQNWRANNPDAINWKQSNPEKARKYANQYMRENPQYRTKSRADRRARERQACPSWVDHKAIAEVYIKAIQLTRETGIPHHVDHIIPLAGASVSGLHVPWNLRAIPAKENQRKSNKVLI